MSFETKSTPEKLMGTGEWMYRMVSYWAQLPDGWTLGEVADVTVDDKDNVYVFSRGTDHPLMVFDKDGRFLRSWGEDGVFVKPHGIAFGGDGYLYCTDDGSHTVRKYTTEGRLMLELGVPGSPAPRMSGQPFHRCTHSALSPQGDIFVSDGYGNARVHKFSPDGRLSKSWGGFGCGPGEFNLPHNITCDPDGWVYVADRENHRVQVFDENGRYETQWNNLHRPCGMCTEARRKPFSFITEPAPGLAVNADFPNLGPRVAIVDHSGKAVARLGDEGPGLGLGQFLAPHGIAIDSRYDIYVAELGTTAWLQGRPGEPVPPMSNLKKLVRVSPK
jgi:DNA-binding beta-propeller fold protein YncE